MVLAPVAQLDRALVSGTKGRRFESYRVYQFTYVLLIIKIVTVNNKKYIALVISIVLTIVLPIVTFAFDFGVNGCCGAPQAFDMYLVYKIVLPTILIISWSLTIFRYFKPRLNAPGIFVTSLYFAVLVTSLIFLYYQSPDSNIREASTIMTFIEKSGIFVIGAIIWALVLVPSTVLLKILNRNKGR